MDLLVNPAESSLLRFTTAGSVDDGKSTLIGRLLYDSKSIFEDQLLAVEESSKRRGDEHVNLALLTDGLRAEREQGITIDVAYRYFATPKRKFIIADTPGHTQYTRNMVTGASTADLAIILVDAREGILEQTMRHSYLASLLRIGNVVLAVNKMDLVDYDEAIFKGISAMYHAFASGLENPFKIVCIPLSALHGDNVVERSEKMTWYDGPTLLEHLETVQVHEENAPDRARFPVQWVIRPMSDQHDERLGLQLHDYRGFAGRMASGSFRVGDEVIAYPSALTTRITGIHTIAGKHNETEPQLSYSITLADEIDISRGDLIANADLPPQSSSEIEAMICWFSDKKMKPRGRYYLRHTSREVRAVVVEVLFKVNISTLERNADKPEFGMNDIGGIRLQCSQPLFFDPYAVNRITGSFILVDEQTNNTVAAGMITGAPKPAADENGEFAI